MTAIVPRTVRKTMAWYWAGLGAGRPAGLQGPQTERPCGTRSPHRTQCSYRRFTLASLWHPAALRSCRMIEAA